ncbi:hypothetical protein GN330_22795 [Nitratireductor sp. CAU 1489]|uniref:Uncharacterized protein n=1 Tax=Nitratireductor arenosus TaxID=2682096 RepID=A0A844QLD3_9HYPH|nr:hypothetical protein [Nitratireductor arenosus]MVB00078.1 hypothetical protein [Nitratireductor arenosus]
MTILHGFGFVAVLAWLGIALVRLYRGEDFESALSLAGVIWLVMEGLGA